MISPSKCVRAYQPHVLNSTSGRFLYIAGKKNLEIPIFGAKGASVRAWHLSNSRHATKWASYRSQSQAVRGLRVFVQCPSASQPGRENGSDAPEGSSGRQRHLIDISAIVCSTLPSQTLPHEPPAIGGWRHTGRFSKTLC